MDAFYREEDGMTWVSSDFVVEKFILFYLLTFYFIECVVGGESAFRRFKNNLCYI